MRIHSEQSWWACDGLGFPSEERLVRIAAAGFAGVHRGIPDAAWCRDCWASGLTWSATAILGTAASIIEQTRRARDLGAIWMNLQLNEDEPAEHLLDAVAVAERETGLPLRVETHRGRITAERRRTIGFCHARPDLRLTLDLSHYVVSEMIDGASDAFAPLFPAVGAVHLRVSNGHQVQVPLAGHQAHLDRFLVWWRSAIAAARERGDIWLPVVCELGPPPYAVCDGTGRELTDRWAEAQVLRRLLDAEHGP
jgi:sugar phosphate isomerase/epimerase